MSQDLWFNFIEKLGILALFMAGMLLLFYLCRRYMGSGRGGKEKWINVLSVHHISNKEKLMLVEVPGQVVLVGVTSSSITHISNLPPDAVYKKNNGMEMKKFPGILEKALVDKGQNYADE